jgi:hypothetical protein
MKTKKDFISFSTTAFEMEHEAARIDGANGIQDYTTYNYTIIEDCNTNSPVLLYHRLHSGL